MQRRSFSIQIALLLGSIVGCNGGNNLASVEGIVTLDGQPLPNANVIFEGQGPQGDSASAYTDANGHFQLKDTIQTVGAKPGQYLVRITAQAVDEYSKPPAIPPKYNRNSQILVTVTNGSNTFNYELKSDPRYKSVEQ